MDFGNPAYSDIRRVALGVTSTPLVPHSWGKKKETGGHPQTPGRDESLHSLGVRLLIPNPLLRLLWNPCRGEFETRPWGRLRQRGFAPSARFDAWHGRIKDCP